MKKRLTRLIAFFGVFLAVLLWRLGNHLANHSLDISDTAGAIIAAILALGIVKLVRLRAAGDTTA